MKLTRSRAVVLMVPCALLWSTAGVVTRHLESARSFEVTFWRSFFTVLSLLLILPMVRGKTVFNHMRKGGLSLCLSGLCWSVMFTAFMVALTLTSVANVLVTLALGPLLTALSRCAEWIVERAASWSSFVSPFVWPSVATIDDPSSLALEPRQGARRNRHDLHPQAEPHLQFTGHSPRVSEAILYF